MHIREYSRNTIHNINPNNSVVFSCTQQVYVLQTMYVVGSYFKYCKHMGVIFSSNLSKRNANTHIAEMMCIFLTFKCYVITHPSTRQYKTH